MIYRFAEFELDDELFELRRRGRPVRAQPKVLDLLLYLIRHPDRVVPRNELLDALWAGVVVGEDALTTAVHQARAALADCHARQWAVRTVSRRGYRFVAAVEAQAADGASADSAATTIAPRGGPMDGAFVGRESEMSRLQAALETVWAGGGRVALHDDSPSRRVSGEIRRHHLESIRSFHGKLQPPNTPASLGVQPERLFPHDDRVQVLL